MPPLLLYPLDLRWNHHTVYPPIHFFEFEFFTREHDAPSRCCQKVVNGLVLATGANLTRSTSLTSLLKGISPTKTHQAAGTRNSSNETLTQRRYVTRSTQADGSPTTKVVISVDIHHVFRWISSDTKDSVWRKES